MLLCALLLGECARKEGYRDQITVENDVVTAVKELAGWVLYIYGGGWDWQDEGSAIQFCYNENGNDYREEIAQNGKQRQKRYNPMFGYGI